MRERLSAIWDSIKEFWAKTSKRIRILILGGLAFVLLLSLVIVLWLNYTDYIVLYNNLTVEENASILAQLQEMGVTGKLEGNNILVPAEKEHQVRMQLAVRGAPTDSGFGHTTFGLGSGLTATQAEKDYYEKAQLQERLEASIKTFPEVRDAHVTITVPESSIFVFQDEVIKPSAAIKIEKMPGRYLTVEQVRGILNLVKDSVVGLEEENISIVDETGDMRLLLDLYGDAHDTKLKLSERVNRSIEARILSLLMPVYGENGVVVKVNSVLDTDEMVTKTTTYIPLDPDNPTNNPLDFYEGEYERTDGNPIVQGVPGATGQIDVPEYGAELLDDGSGNYYRSHNIYDYLVSSEVQEIVRAGLTVTDLTVAVLINRQDMANNERDKVYDMVATASGVEREKVSVQNMAFTLPTYELEDLAPGGMPLHLLIIIIVGILALLTIIIIAMMMVSKKKKEAAAAEAEYEEESTLLELMGDMEEDFEPIQLAETQEQKLKSQIKDLASSDPEIVAQLIKTWLINT